MKAVLLDGSPAANSRVSVLLQAVRQRLVSRGLETELLTLLTMQLPVNNPEYHNLPEENSNAGVRDFIARIQAADIVVLGTPLYHGSYSGILKMAIDHLPDDALAGKRIAIVSNSSSLRNVSQASQELVPVVRALKGDLLNRLVGTYGDDYGVRDDVFQIVDATVNARLDVIADELAA
jgi:NAD(P)H-dependent FMN reductase